MGDSKLLFENTGAYVSLNGEIIETRRYAAETPDAGFWDAAVAYEVLRVASGVPLFFEDHCERLNKSLAKLGARASAAPETLASRVGALLRANAVTDGNVKLWAAPVKPPVRLSGTARDAPQTEPNIFLNVNRSYDPNPEYYENGAPAGLMAYTRNDPNIKRYIAGYKERVRELTENGSVYEVLLYDGARRLTEGSRSNLFFTKNGIVYTAPADIILVGIRRRHIFAAARRLGIRIVEEPVTLDEVENKAVDGAFITGTGIGVLPVSQIDGAGLRSAGDPVIRKIMGEYEKIARDYIEARRT